MFVHEFGSGTPVVLLHGFGLDHRSLLPLEPIFTRSGGWQRLYLDLPGATRSPAGDVDGSQQVAEAVREQITAHLGDRRFAVLGSSFGGMIARYVAHEMREQVLGLATLAAVFVAPRQERHVPVRTVLHRDDDIEPLLGESLERYREDAVVESTDDARAFVRHVLPGIEGGDPHALDRIAQRYSLDQEPEHAHSDPFLRPTLHITGRQDNVVGYIDAWERIEHYPRATFAVLDAAGHNLLFEQAATCSALVSDWLTRLRLDP